LIDTVPVWMAWTRTPFRSDIDDMSRTVSKKS